MIYNDIEERDLQRVFFPVREANVYVESVTGEHERIPRKKALINDYTCKILSVVSDRYQVLENRTALELAKTCCMKAFPYTAPARWRVFSIEAPLTLGHCRIDLKYEGKIEGYDWSFGEAEQDLYVPFIRVYNSYNRTTAFSIRFGLMRWACKNGMVDWHSSITIKVAHDVNEMERLIEAQINEAKFRNVIDKFRELITPLRDVAIDEKRFLPVLLSVLRIRKPENMPDYRENDWCLLESRLFEVASQYIEELGENGYALLNAITDVATNPPQKIGNYNFIHRERDGLQRLAGIWLVNFSKLIDKPQALRKYLSDPSSKTLVLPSREGGSE